MREQINADLKAAMKAGEKDRVATLRLINAAIKSADIDARPSSPVGDGPDGEAVDEAFPVPSDATGDETRRFEGDGRPSAGMAGADDGLPSSSPVEEATASPVGPGDEPPGAAAPPRHAQRGD